MARKKATLDELEARTEANGYRRETHREEDSRRNCNKREYKTKKDQDTTLGQEFLLMEADKWIENYIPDCEGAIGENPSVVLAQAMGSLD
jgi:hypothetical protein